MAKSTYKREVSAPRVRITFEKKKAKRQNKTKRRQCTAPWHDRYKRLASIPFAGLFQQQLNIPSPITTTRPEPTRIAYALRQRKVSATPDAGHVVSGAHGRRNERVRNKRCVNSAPDYQEWARERKRTSGKDIRRRDSTRDSSMLSRIRAVTVCQRSLGSSHSFYLSSLITCTLLRNKTSIYLID